MRFHGANCLFSLPIVRDEAVAIADQNLLLLGYLVVGLAVFLRQGSLKAGADQTSLPIRLLMGFSGLSLLLQAIFQFPLIPGNTDLSSWQRVIGFHKTDERADDLVIAAFAFLLSMAILRVVRSHTYVAYTVKLLDYETTVLARERRRVTAQLARQELIAHQGEMEAEKARCREQKTKLLRKLSGENEMKDKRVSRTEPDATVPPRDHPSTSVSSKQEEQSILTKEILTTAPEGDSPMSKRLLHWLIDNSDPVLAIGAGAQPDGLHMPTHSSRLHKEVRLLSKFKAAVKLVRIMAPYLLTTDKHIVSRPKAERSNERLGNLVLAYPVEVFAGTVHKTLL